MTKSLVIIRLNKKILKFSPIFLLSSFLIIFLLEFTVTIPCVPDFTERNKAEERAYEMQLEHDEKIEDSLERAYRQDLYLAKNEKEKQLVILSYEQLMFIYSIPKQVRKASKNPYAEAGVFNFNPCNTPSYIGKHNTLFGIYVYNQEYSSTVCDCKSFINKTIHHLKDTFRDWVYILLGAILLTTLYWVFTKVKININMN